MGLEITYKKFKKDEDFVKIYNLYYKEIFYVINKIVKNVELSEEITNDVFLKIKDLIEKYDEKYAFKTWLYTIAINEAKTFFNKEKKKKTTSCDFTSVEIGGEDLPFLEIEARKAYYEYVTEDQYDEEIDIKYKKLVDLIHDLNEKYKGIMIDREINRMSMSELSKKYKINENTVKSRLKDGRNKVAKMYLKFLEDENTRSNR